MRCLMRVNFAARLPYEIILYPIVARGTHACAENIKSWLELARDQPLPELRLCGVSRDRKRVMGQVVAPSARAATRLRDHPSPNRWMTTWLRAAESACGPARNTLFLDSRQHSLSVEQAEFVHQQNGADPVVVLMTLWDHGAEAVLPGGRRRNSAARSGTASCRRA